MGYGEYMAVEFNEPTYGTSPRPEKVSYITRMVIKSGLAKNKHAAELVLLVIAAIAIALAIAIPLYLMGASPIIEVESTENV